MFDFFKDYKSTRLQDNKSLSTVFNFAMSRELWAVLLTTDCSLLTANFQLSVFNFQFHCFNLKILLSLFSILSFISQ